MATLFLSFINYIQSQWQNIFFIFKYEERIKTDIFIQNIIIYISKNQIESQRKKAYNLLYAIIKNYNINKKLSNTRITALKSLKISNSNISLYNSCEEIDYFFKKLNFFEKDNKDILTQINEVNLSLISNINHLQKITKIISITILIIVLICSFYFSNYFLFITLVIPIVIVELIKRTTQYKFYNIIKNLQVQIVTEEESAYYKLIEKYNPNLKKKIDINNKHKELEQKYTKKKNDSIANKNFISNKIKTEDCLNLDDDLIIELIKTNKYGHFQITQILMNNDDKTEYQKIINNMNSYFDKIFDIATKEFKEHILQNISLIIKHGKCSNIINKWTEKQKDNLAAIISATSNKNNLLSIFSNINYLKQNLLKNNVNSNKAVVDNLDKIEETFLTNMSLNNFIDLFEFIEKSKEKITILNYDKK